MDLGGCVMEGVEFRFPAGGGAIEAGQRAVLASNLDPSAFALRYPGIEVWGYYEGILSNGGERLTLRDPSGAVVSAVTYSDGAPWPELADGGGASLERVRFRGDPDDAASWQASVPGGSPGTANAGAAEPQIVLNEVMAENVSAFDLAGMSLNVREDRAGAWVFPTGSEIEAGGYLLLWCSEGAAGSTSFSADMNVGKALRGEGGNIYLYDASGQVVDSIAYGFQVDDISVGRTENGWGLLAQPTPRIENAPLAELGDFKGVRFNEWRAAGESDDWFELYNPGDLPVTLSGLYFTDHPGIASQTEFRSGQGALNAAVQVGPVVINEIMYHPLDETGAEEGEDANFEYVELVNVGAGEVALFDLMHPTNGWRLSGGIEFMFPTGLSLQRRALHWYGNEPLHWKASAPTAGQSKLDPADMDLDQDGLPDEWEETHGLDPGNALDAGWDHDGDGQTNLAEYLAGTDPGDAEDVLTLDFELGDQVQRLVFRAQPGRSYSVQYCDDLAWGIWLRIADVYAGEIVRDIHVEVEEWPEANQRLYRVIMPAQP